MERPTTGHQLSIRYGTCDWPRAKLRRRSGAGIACGLDDVSHRIGVAWVTSTMTPFSAPNDAFAPDPSNIGDSILLSPTFSVPAGGATLTFKNNFNTESTFDGMVLEISINGGAFADIIAMVGSLH